MKTSDLLILAAAAGLAWWLISSGSATAKVGAGDTATGATLIREWAGWRYYSDGTVIGPDGSYYYRGDLVYSPDAVLMRA